MNEHEEGIIRVFIRKEKRERIRLLWGDPKRRKDALDRLNHFNDLSPSRVEWIPGGKGILEILRLEGSPDKAYLISSVERLDGVLLPLDKAIEATQNCAWGTIVSCIPGRLAYYHDEGRSRHGILRGPKHHVKGAASGS